MRCVWLKYQRDVKNHQVVLKTSNMTEISLQSLKKNPRYHSNMAKLSGFNAIMVLFKIFSILIENETVKCEEKKKGNHQMWQKNCHMWC